MASEEVAITGAPNEKVANLAVPEFRFDENLRMATVKSSWRIPTNLTARTNPRRAEEFAAWVGMWTTAPAVSVGNLNPRPGGYHYCLPATYGTNISSYSETFSLTKFFPYTQTGPKLERAYIYVTGWNWVGDMAWADKAYATMNFLKPHTPTVSAPELDDSDGTVSCNVRSTGTADRRHWAQTAVSVECYDSLTKNTVTSKHFTTSTDYDVPAVNVSGIQGIAGDRWWRYRVTAVAQGVAGESSGRTRELYVSQPRRATVSASLSGTAGNSKLVLNVKANATTEHPVTGMRIQALRSTTITSADAASAADGWEDFDAADDGRCTCLVCEVSDVRPDPDTVTWVRVKTWNLSETLGSLHNWSGAIRLTKLETKAPTRAPGSCGIIDVTPAKNGLSAQVRVGWTEGTTNTGTELSWSDNPNAWSATDSPSTATFSGNGSASSGTGWTRESTVTLSSLTPGTTYWIRARRYLTSSGSTLYTAYCKAFSFKPQGAENDSCGIVSVKPDKDGTGATVIVGFTEDSANTGTEVTWSADPNAWWSSDQPQSMQATWVDSARKSADWQETATVYLRGLAPGTTYYVRARRYLEAGGSTTYSPMSKVGSFATPEQSRETVEGASIAIVSIAPGEDGESADLVIGWNEQSAADGTEVTWSDREDAWESTDQPNSFQAAWADASSRSASWGATQVVHIEGLEQGTTYWVRARRYGETDGGTAHSQWSTVATVEPSAMPTSVTMSAPAYVRRGASLPLAWSFGGGSAQTAWRLMSGGKVVMEGTDAAQACVVPAMRLSGLVGSSGSVQLAVEVSTGGEFRASDPVSVTVADLPALIVAGATVTAQPMAVSLTCSSPSDLSIVVTALGARGAHPGGDRVQATGDCVWSAAVSPEWSGDGPYAATVVARTDLDLWQGAEYLVTAVATDRTTGLRSDEAVALLDVDWAHPAPSPGECVVTPSDVTGEGGLRTLSCEVELVAGDGAGEHDVYDVWRLSPGGADLVARGVAAGEVVRDRYAPLGHGSYRVATRTPDGDLDWLDFAYELPCDSMRVDWGNSYVELPYNLAWSYARRKDFEAVGDISGGTEGYWGPGVERTASLSTDVVRVDASQAERLHGLALWPGPAFVRTPDGMAYCANVDVGGMDFRYGSAAVPVTLDATRVALTDDFVADLVEDGGD